MKMIIKRCSECEEDITFDEDGYVIGGCGNLECPNHGGLDYEEDPQELDFSDQEELGIDREIPDPTVE